MRERKGHCPSPGSPPARHNATRRAGREEAFQGRRLGLGEVGTGLVTVALVEEGRFFLLPSHQDQLQVNLCVFSQIFLQLDPIAGTPSQSRPAVFSLP